MKTIASLFLVFIGIAFCQVAKAQDTVVFDEASVDEDDESLVPFDNPVFPGGDEALRKYLTENVRQPQESDANGRIIVGFFIDTIGNVTDARLLRNLDEYCDAEALRLISNMPRWTPAHQNGKPIKTSYALPVYFGKKHQTSKHK